MYAINFFRRADKRWFTNFYDIIFLHTVESFKVFDQNLKRLYKRKKYEIIISQNSY